MKYLYKIGLILSVVLTAGACSGQLDTIQEYLDAGETIYAAKMDSVDIRPGYNRVEVTGLLKYGMDTERCVIHWTPDNDSLVVPVKRIDPVDTFRVFIENLPEGTYQFEIVTYNKSGYRSISTSKGGKTYGDRYISSLRVRSLLSTEVEGENLLLNFSSEMAEALATKVFYLNSAGEKQEQEVARGDNQIKITDWKPRGAYEVKTYYIPEVNAVDTFSVSSTGVFPEKIVEMDKSTFREIILDNDIRLNAWGGALWKAWDNAYENTNYAHSDNTNPIVFPAWFTFDLGETALLKRFDLFSVVRDDLNYNGGNMKSWEIWGREDEPVNSSWDGWTKLMTCNSFKSSGKPVGENTDEDNAYIAKGEKFDFPSGIPEVRYVRIKVLDSWSGQGYVQFSEFTFYKSE